MLEAWLPVLVGPDGAVAIAGIVFGDRKGRWPDRTAIPTSPVIAPDRIETASWWSPGTVGCIEFMR